MPPWPGATRERGGARTRPCPLPWRGWLSIAAGSRGIPPNMKRLTISVDACIETLALLITKLIELFKAIPARLEGDGTENFDVAFE